jgi:hypothetical protein
MDPRFFRRYLDILDEQPTSATVNYQQPQPTSATVNVGDNTTATVDTAAKTIGMQTKVGDLNLKATQDFSTTKQGAGQLSADYQVDPNTTVGATATQAGYNSQMTPTSQIRASSNLSNVGKVDIERTQGPMLQGPGKNAKPGDSSVTTMRVTNPQGQTATYGTNRNL